MAENSKIEWTDHTFNPWIGCQKVGPGCDNCYAEDMMAKRYGRVEWGPHASRSRTAPANWEKPLKWDRDAAAASARRRVFCASLADVFDNHSSISPAWRLQLWDLIRRTPNLDWMLLTKRPSNIARMLPPDWGAGWPNVWLGCTVTDQAEVDRDVPKLLEVSAKVRFLSMEPLLGQVDLTALPYSDLGNARTYQDALRGKLWMPAGTVDWPIDPRCTVGNRTYVNLRGMIHLVIAGGESGTGARPVHPDWARGLRDQCQAAGVAFHFKQWGEWMPVSEIDGPGARHTFPDGVTVRRAGKVRAGRSLDGQVSNQMPFDRCSR